MSGEFLQLSRQNVTQNVFFKKKLPSQASKFFSSILWNGSFFVQWTCGCTNLETHQLGGNLETFKAIPLSHEEKDIPLKTNMTLENPNFQ